MLVLCAGVMAGNAAIIESAQQLDVILQHEVKEMFEFVTTASNLDNEHDDSFYVVLTQSLSKCHVIRFCNKCIYLWFTMYACK